MRQILRSPLESKRARVHFANVDLVDLVREHGTPAYVTHRQTLEDNYLHTRRTLARLHSPSQIYVAVKANPGLYELHVLSQLAACVDVLSVGEAVAAHEAGIPFHAMRFTTAGATLREYGYMAERGIPITFDAPLHRVRCVLDKIELPSSLGFRVNPGVGIGLTEGLTTAGRQYQKFGIRGDLSGYLQAAKAVDPHASLFVHAHLGTDGDQKRVTEVYIEALRRLVDIAHEAQERTGISIVGYSMGGGYPAVWPYDPDDEVFDMDTFLTDLITAFRIQVGGGILKPSLDLEPGRRIFATATILLCEVQYTYTTEDGKQAAYVNTGFNHLARPILYGAHHQIVVANKPDEAATKRTIVYGNVCESGDTFGEEMLPPLEEGDVLAILHYGAYGVSMASNYTSRSLPLGLAIDGDRVLVTRRREDVREDLLRSQRDAMHDW